MRFHSYFNNNTISDNRSSIWSCFCGRCCDGGNRLHQPKNTTTNAAKTLRRRRRVIIGWIVSITTCTIGCISVITLTTAYVGVTKKQSNYYHYYDDVFSLSDRNQTYDSSDTTTTTTAAAGGGRNRSSTDNNDAVVIDVNDIMNDDNDDEYYYYRFAKVRLNHDIIASHEFLRHELQVTLQEQEQQQHPQRRPQQQLLIGRFGNSESEIMEYALLPNNTTRSIPSNYYTPGYYFTMNETSIQQHRETVRQWGYQRIDAYTKMNLFAIFHWSYNILQMKGIQTFAPLSGYIHANTMYPPCLTIPKLSRENQHHNNNNNHTTPIVPWTLMLENKVILIIHPFIDTIRNNIPNIHHIWSNVAPNNDDNNDNAVMGAPYSCFPNVTEIKYIRPPLPTRVDINTISWMESLARLNAEIDQIGYFDIALIGCGGYGLPVMSYISTLSFAPSAIYMGGALQLLFGIHGNRWSTPSENQYYAMWSPIYNHHWTWPLVSDIENSTIDMIEDSAYVRKKEKKTITKYR